MEADFVYSAGAYICDAACTGTGACRNGQRHKRQRCTGTEAERGHGIILSTTSSGT